MPVNYCAVCQKELISLELKTVANQCVCCLSCVGLLHSISEDACDFCYRPVWKDNYFTLNKKYYCSENCKEKKIKQMLSEKLITDAINIKEQHHQDEKIYISSPQTDSKKLREEALEIFNELDKSIIPKKNNSFNINYFQRNLTSDKSHIGKSIFNNLNPQISKIKGRQRNKKKIINRVIINNKSPKADTNRNNIFKKINRINSDYVCYKFSENSNKISKSNSKTKVKLRVKNSRVCLVNNKTTNNKNYLSNNNRQIFKKIQNCYNTLSEYNTINNNININNISNKSEIILNNVSEDNIFPKMLTNEASCFKTSIKKENKIKNCENRSKDEKIVHKDLDTISRVITGNENYCNNCNKIISKTDEFYLGKNNCIFCSYDCRKNYQLNIYYIHKTKKSNNKLL